MAFGEVRKVSFMLLALRYSFHKLLAQFMISAQLATKKFTMDWFFVAARCFVCCTTSACIMDVDFTPGLLSSFI